MLEVTSGDPPTSNIFPNGKINFESHPVLVRREWSSRPFFPFLRNSTCISQLLWRDLSQPVEIR
jgi:hypothetical protein